MSVTKEKINILVIDRPWGKEEKPVLMFEKYEKQGFDIVIFPFTETKRRIEVIFFDFLKRSIFEKLFHISIDYDLDEIDPFFDFVLREVDEQTFYDILDQVFEVLPLELTVVEKKPELFPIANS